MSRIALLSDIHGNATALEAVLHDAAGQGATAYWHLGDAIGPGPGFPDIAGHLADVGTDVHVRGNWDDAIEEVRRGEVDLNDHSDIYVTVFVAWLLDRITSQQAAAVAAWPLADTRQIAGLRVQACHNLPHVNHGRGLFVTSPQEDLAGLCGDADVTVFGHYHEQTLRWSQGRVKLVVSPGSVGSAWAPRQGLPPAEYAILRLSEGEAPSVDFRSVAYDHARELARARAAQLPYLELYEHQVMRSLTYTHDQDVLRAIEAREGYRAVAERFLARLSP